MTNPPLPRGKLTELDVITIKKLLWKGALQGTIANQYQVSQPTISHILRGSQWGWIPWPDGTEGPMLLDRKLAITKGVAKKEHHVTEEAHIAAKIIEQKEVKKEEEAERDLLRAIKRVPKKSRPRAKTVTIDKTNYEFILNNNKAKKILLEFSEPPKTLASALYVLSTTLEKNWDTPNTRKIIKNLIKQN